MKKFTLLLIALLVVKTGFGATAARSSKIEKSLVSIAQFYEELQQADLLTNYNLYINFTHEQEALDELISQNLKCKPAKSYSKTTSLGIESLFREHLSYAIEVSVDESLIIEYHNRLELILAKLTKALSKSKKIERCSLAYNPAYSDGHEVHFIKVDGKILFATELGYAD